MGEWILRRLRSNIEEQIKENKIKWKPDRELPHYISYMTFAWQRKQQQRDLIGGERYLLQVDLIIHLWNNRKISSLHPWFSSIMYKQNLKVETLLCKINKTGVKQWKLDNLHMFVQWIVFRKDHWSGHSSACASCLKCAAGISSRGWWWAAAESVTLKFIWRSWFFVQSSKIWIWCSH